MLRSSPISWGMPAFHSRWNYIHMCCPQFRTKPPQKSRSSWLRESSSPKNGTIVPLDLRMGDCGTDLPRESPVLDRHLKASANWRLPISGKNAGCTSYLGSDSDCLPLVCQIRKQADMSVRIGLDEERFFRGWCALQFDGLGVLKLGPPYHPASSSVTSIPFSVRPSDPSCWRRVRADSKPGRPPGSAPKKRQPDSTDRQD